MSKADRKVIVLALLSLRKDVAKLLHKKSAMSKLDLDQHYLAAQQAHANIGLSPEKLMESVGKLLQEGNDGSANLP